MPDRLQVFDVVEAFHISHAVAALHKLDLFTALTTPVTAEELASKHALDAGILRGVLEYVSARTDLLRKSGERFVMKRNHSGGSRFLLDLYIGAYGSNAKRLDLLLRDPSVARTAVDRVRQARAFAAVDGSTVGFLPVLIRRLEFSHLLDLGCGTGALLLSIAEQDSDFAGWGIDLNPSMCKFARARIRAAGLGKRIRIFEGDCSRIRSVLTRKVLASVGAVTACNVANELFADGNSQAIEWLRSLRKALPGRPLLIADYYGRLGRKKKTTSRETLLHDFAQLISGQGVPPASAAEWRSIYKRAGCRLVHIIEDKTTTQFIHILRL